MLEARFTPRTVFMEIGSADQTLALRAASYVERVYSIQVGQLQQGVRAPCNLRPVLCDGIRIPAFRACMRCRGARSRSKGWMWLAVARCSMS